MGLHWTQLRDSGVQGRDGQSSGEEPTCLIHYGGHNRGRGCAPVEKEAGSL